VKAVIEPGRFRHVLGHYPTGVCAITSTFSGSPIAMVVGSFTSVSLAPPLVAFFPAVTSSSWPKIEQAGRFCVNVLAHPQVDLCRAITAKSDEWHQAISREPTQLGLPRLDGAVAWIDCEIHAIHGAGDHFVVLGEVQSLEVDDGSPPLLFLRGGYGQFAANAGGAA
jgi:3-hydroxy-9,10-secoandrosta-1,3,5(10)-triene-9,17-dione monooxygenase reductase component